MTAFFWIFFIMTNQCNLEEEHYPPSLQNHIIFLKVKKHSPFIILFCFAVNIQEEKEELLSNLWRKVKSYFLKIALNYLEFFLNYYVVLWIIFSL